jgi:DNA-binding LytR/AlgR family response regulator
LTVDCASERVSIKSVSLTADLTLAAPYASSPTLLVGQRERSLYLLTAQNVDYIESQGNYVRLHCGDVKYTSRDSIKRLAIILAGSGFVRIEHSLLLNVRAIVHAQRVGRGAYRFTLHSGVSLRSGARYRSSIVRVIPSAQPRQ